MTGSISEGKWLGAGLSHVLEHMLFKGTATRPGSRIDQEVQSVGGYMNAYTSFDRTVFHINVPNTGAKVAVDILCDIMQNATLPPEELSKELEVIRREMDMNQDDPGRRAGRRLFECAFTKSPYRFTIIGYPGNFQHPQAGGHPGLLPRKIRPEQHLLYCRRRHQSGRCHRANPPGLRRQQSQSAAALVLPREPRQTAPREMIEEAPIELGYFHIAWHIPDIRHPDMPALDILASLLGNGRSSRLFREVREKKALVTSVDAWTYSPGEQGLFGISAMASAAKFAPRARPCSPRSSACKNSRRPRANWPRSSSNSSPRPWPRAKPCKARRRTSAPIGWRPTTSIFPSAIWPPPGGSRPPRCNAPPGKYLTPSNRTLFALLPAGAAPKSTETERVSAQFNVRKLEFPNGLRLLLKEDHRLPFIECARSSKAACWRSPPPTAA